MKKYSIKSMYNLYSDTGDFETDEDAIDYRDRLQTFYSYKLNVYNCDGILIGR